MSVDDQCQKESVVEPPMPSKKAARMSLREVPGIGTSRDKFLGLHPLPLLTARQLYDEGS